MKLLAAADIHLGRRPSRLPSLVTDRIPARELGPSAAWESLVDLAIREEVDALLLAGDVVNADRDFFEAHTQLQRGVRRLSEAGVRVIAVAGNHDTHVLPSLAKEVPEFELVGLGGTWQSVRLSSGDESVSVWGWSFPQAVVRTSPLTEPGLEPGAGVNIGLLHCDLDQQGSRYAPVSSRELRDAGMDAWLLGHIHVPAELSGDQAIGYLGSLTGLDPGEYGARGAWMISVRGGRIESFDRRAFAPLRWVREEIELGGSETPEDARSLVLERLRTLDDGIRDEPHPPRAVGVRLSLVGRSSSRGAIAALFDGEEMGELSVGDGSVHYFIETVRVETLPPVDLEELAREPNPAGLLAGRLLVLDRPTDDSERQQLVADALRQLASVNRTGHWQTLESGALDDDEVAGLLKSSGGRALDLLLAQREES